MRRLLLLLAVGVVSLSLAGPVAANEAGAVAGVVRVQALEVDLELRRSVAATGDRVHVVATVRNQGTASLRDLSVALRAPDGIAVDPHERRAIAHLRGGASRLVRWQVCGDDRGVYGLLAQVEGERPGGQDVTVESTVQLLELGAEGRHPCR